jgi:hypothetical protein
LTRGHTTTHTKFLFWTNTPKSVSMGELLVLENYVPWYTQYILAVIVPRSAHGWMKGYNQKSPFTCFALGSFAPRSILLSPRCTAGSTAWPCGACIHHFRFLLLPVLLLRQSTAQLLDTAISPFWKNTKKSLSCMLRASVFVFTCSDASASRSESQQQVVWVTGFMAESALWLRSHALFLFFQTLSPGMGFR